MKDTKKGFTLIELLTVIAIIGILAGIIIPAVGAVRKNAKKVKTQAMFSQWAAAMELFKQDYGYMPIFTFPQNEDGEFYNVMTGDPADTTFNKKNIRYYSFSNDAIALDSPYGVTDGLIVEAFGNPNIGMAVDTDRDGIIDSGERNGAPTSSDVRSSVIFWTEVPTANKRDFEEVKSWE